MDNEKVPTHNDIIDMWPSFSEFEHDSGACYMTVRQWITRNSIPSKYWTRVVVAAHDRDLPVTYKLLAEGCAIQNKALIQNSE